jgi:hypothetical protein
MSLCLIKTLITNMPTKIKPMNKENKVLMTNSYKMSNQYVKW